MSAIPGGGREVHVPAGELAVSNDPREVLTTSLGGSGLVVLVHDAGVRVGGLLHFMLPGSAPAGDPRVTQPGRYCDTGVPLLFQSAYALGAARERLVVRVAGGGQLLAGGPAMDLGKRNYLALRKLFWKNGVEINAERVGGQAARSVSLLIFSGEIVVAEDGVENLL